MKMRRDKQIQHIFFTLTTEGISENLNQNNDIIPKIKSRIKGSSSINVNNKCVEKSQSYLQLCNNLRNNIINTYQIEMLATYSLHLS